MKIGLFTLPLHSNYGGVIQAFALMTVLKNLGHNVWLVDRKKNPKLKKVRFKQRLKNTLQRLGLMNKPLVGKSLGKFIDNYIQPMTRTYFSSEDLKCDIDIATFDAFVVGSDQVWRPKYAEDCLYDFFFQFIDSQLTSNVKKIAYAASFGTSDWEYSIEQSRVCNALLQQFSAVAVREDSAKDLCKQHWNVDAFHALDPTMLLTKEDYISIVDKATTLPAIDGELFVYHLNVTQDKNEVVDFAKKQLNLVDFAIGLENTSSMEEWLRAFKDADFIITDSFHACVFSILFNKRFIAYGNRARGLTRFTSLLKVFDLEDRLIFSSAELSEELLSREVDWNKVNDRLDQQRNQSIGFLKNSFLPSTAKLD